MNRRKHGAWFVAGVLGLAGGLGNLAEKPAEASVARAILFDDLVRESQTASVVTAVESRSAWENGRIYTYTRVRVDRPVAGELELGAGQEGWIRTMGGVVGDVGQSVEGEPVLNVGKSSLLFLHPGPIGTFEVTGRAQGQFPLVTEGGLRVRLLRNANLGVLLTHLKPLTEWIPGAQGTAVAPSLVDRRLYAVDVLHERFVEDATKEISSAWVRIHGKR